MSPRPTQAGFALLLTIIVVSVVLAIGLSLMNLTVKQLSLSTTARDSEMAFYAANAGIECAQSERLTFDPITAIPDTVLFNCFNQTENVSKIVSNPNNSPTGRTHHYSHAFSWISDEQPLCSVVNIFVLDARAAAYMQPFTSLGLANKTCAAGNICTVMFSTGYNRACNNLAGLRTVQRELTIEF